MKKGKQWLLCLLYLLLKCVVAYLPSWTVRKTIYRLLGMKIGVHSRVGIGTMVVCPWQIKIGKDTVINENCHLDGRGGLTIGNHVSVSLQTMIITASHESKSATFAYYKKAVCIEDYAWIGARSIILEGAQIRRAALIGAGSTFRGTAEEDFLYSGVPAQKIRRRGLEGEYELNYKVPFI